MTGHATATSPDRARRQRSATRHFAVGLARAVGGAAIFSLPVLMTMEMWTLGFAIDRDRLALLLVVTVPLLVGLSHVAGFEETFDLREDALDAFVAYAVGFATAAVVLSLFGVLQAGMSLDEIVGKLALQAVPGSIGALLAQSQLGGAHAGETNGEASGARNDDAARGDAPARARPSGYWSQVFLMGVGALFLSFNVAPTEEVLRIAFVMDEWRMLALVLASIAAMHAFVYAVEFRGQERATPGTPWWSVLLRYTVVGYAVACAICAYMLWTFGRLDGTGPQEAVGMVLVLAFPGAIGAAAARLIL